MIISAINSASLQISCFDSFQMIHKQGIVSILTSGNEKTTKAESLRRTLSADMSSRRWLAEKGLKKVASSEQIASCEQIVNDSSSSSSSEEDEEECEVAKGKGKGKGEGRLDIWTAIMSQKVQDESVKLPPPYVHPLVKKSGSSLSEKSLKVCTESLGSETGSDVFPENKEVVGEEPKVVKFASKKAQQARSFPPPLPSLAAAQTDGPSLHMHSRRLHGRLVLEAVSVPPQKYFEAQRQDGRFLLTLINNPKEPTSQNLVFNLSAEEQKSQIQDDEMESDKEMGIFKEQPPKLMNEVHRSTVSMKRMTERDNQNPSWSPKLNTKAKIEAVEEASPAAPITRRATGLPPLPSPPAAATSFNSYQYFWKAKPSVASVIDPLITQHLPPTKAKDLVLLRGNKADCLLPSLKGCKEPRRSLLMWEPFCIATS